MAVSPGLPGGPAALAGDEGRLGLRGGLLAEALSEPSAPGGSRGGRSRGCSGSLQSQPLLARQISLLRALLALQQTVLRLEHPLLLALRPRPFHLLRLQLLHALLKAIDAGLTLRGLARQHLALPLLDVLLALLDTLLALKQAALRLQQPLLLVLRPCAFWLLRLQLLHALLQAVDAALAFRGLARKHLARPCRPIAHGRRCAWPRGGGDMRHRPRCHGRTLRRCRRPMKFGPRRRHVRGGSLRRRSEMWGRTRWR
jgi:hypothetical protein